MAEAGKKQQKTKISPEEILRGGRPVQLRPDSFWMVGDNQTEIEKNVAPEQIIALLTGFVRKGRTHGTDEIPYRVLSLVWLFLRPLRPAFHMIRAVFRPHRE